MSQAKQQETFDQVLLSHVETCYSAALALTNDPHDARNLTRDVVTNAWELRDNAPGKRGVKMMLLAALLEQFHRDYRRPTPSFGNGKALAQRS